MEIIKIDDYTYMVNNITYDTREEGNKRYIEDLINKEKLKGETITEKNKNESWNCPLNTEYINDKNMDYKILAIMTLYSNYKGEEVCNNYDYDISEIEYHRYLYEKGNNSIWSNKEEIEKLSNSKIKNIKRGIKKLAECNNEVVIVCKDKEDRVFYKIYPYANKEQGMGKFITIDSRMLEYLVNTSNSNTIKTYCALKILLWDNKNKCYTRKKITRDFLLRFIGLSVNGKNLTMMGDILKSLKNNHFINRELETETININGDIKVKTNYIYEINSVETWKDRI